MKKSSVFLPLLLVVFVVWYFDGSLESFFVGFIGALLIIIATLYRSYARIQAALQSPAEVELAHQNTQSKDDDEEEEFKSADTQYLKYEESKNQENQEVSLKTLKKLKKQQSKMTFLSPYRLRNGLFLSFAPLRLMAYMIFIVMVLALINAGKLEVVSLFVGNGIAMVAVVLYLYCYRLRDK
ncbi:hypothetical protein CCZ01_03685 [Helicobacter monodelphidis]|uniref:hypothetical protein n=1 Tax=Helicobacter sp. 15-1451 TaxID=2004995 RepID=UPI000DCAF9A0|nr:hypothetical protein [Helicobacter sp. 15-1451]RAX58186.1 hypothetical protein CCZ01_03685 [Helicobacter sp. 15-1451]